MKGLRIMQHIKDDWSYFMYLFITFSVLVASQLSLNWFLSIIIFNFCFAAVGESLIDFIIEKLKIKYGKGSNLLEKKLTEITPEGDYSLPAENLYEAIEKLGYIEHHR